MSTWSKLTGRHARAAARLLAVGLLMLAVTGTSLAASGPKQRRTSASFKATQTQDNPTGGCHGEDGIVIGEVAGAIQYHVEYWDGYWKQLEKADVTPAQINTAAAPLRKAHEVKATQGYLGVTGGWGSGPCGNGKLDNSDGGRFSKGAKAWAIFPANYKPKFELGGHVKDRNGKPVKGVAVQISGPTSVTRKTDADGLYAAFLKKGKYVVTAKGYNPVETSECVVSGKSCKVNLIQDRTADFEEKSATLELEVKLGPYVHGPTYHDAVRAGYAFKVDVSMRDTSRTKRVVVPGDSLWAHLSGNAYDGHLQPEADPVYNVGGATGQGSEVQLSPDVLLQPKETRRFSFIVRTRSLSIDWVEGSQAPKAKSNTTAPATAVIRAPRAGELPKGSLDGITEKDVTWLDPAKDVDLQGDTCDDNECTFKLPVDDSEPEAPPWSKAAFAGELAAGVPGAILSWTVGTIRGIVWDLPNAAAAWFFGQLYAEDELLTYWDAVDNGPDSKEMLARYAEAVKARIDKEHADAKFLADNSPGLLARIESALRQHWTEVAEQYYKGDWHQAAQTMSTEATSGTLDAVTLVAPGALARLSGISKLAEAYRAEKIAKASAEASTAAEELAKISQAEIEAASFAKSERLLTEAEQAADVEGKLGAGTALGTNELEQLGGFSSDELSAIAKVGDGDATGGRRIVSIWKGRSKFAAALRDAIGKPSWMKPKGIDIPDVKYLGEPASELSTQVWTEPPFLSLVQQGRKAEAERQFLSRLKKWFTSKGEPFTGADAKEAAARWNERVGEWTSSDKQQVQALLERAKAAEQNGGKTTVTWENNGNFVDSAKYPNSDYDVNFKVEETTTDAKTDPFGPRKRYTPEGNEQVGAPLERYRSDHDALLFVYENGAPLTDADRNAVYQFLREKGILKHGDTGSFTNAKFRAKILTGGTGGYARAADGKWYYVRYTAGRSEYVDPGNFRQVFDGLPQVPNAP